MRVSPQNHMTTKLLPLFLLALSALGQTCIPQCSSGGALTPIAPNTILGNPTGSTAVPVAYLLPHLFAATFATQPQGTTIYLPPALFSGTITSWRITVDAGTATVDVWKVAVGAFPAVANTITASATPAVSSGTTATSSTLTGWTTAVAVGDMVAINLRAISGASVVNIEVYYQ